MKKLAIALMLSLGLSACDDASGPPMVATTKNVRDVAVTLKEVSTDTSIDITGSIPDAGEGATYVIAKYSLKNNGKASVTMDQWPQVKLVDPNGAKLEPDVLASTYLSASDNIGWAEPLNPNLSTDITQAWKVDARSFDRSKWKIEFENKPPVTFALQ